MQPGDTVIGPHPRLLGERVEATLVGFVTVQLSPNALGGPPPPVRRTRLRYGGQTYDVDPDLVEPVAPAESE
jgi:hypothetical protein